MWQHITSLLFLLAVAFSVVCWNGFAMESAHNVTSSSPTNTVQQITHLTESNNRLQHQIADLRQDIEQLKQQVTQLNNAPLEPQQALGDTSGTTAHEAPPEPQPTHPLDHADTILEARFAEDPLDPNWASFAEAEVSNSIVSVTSTQLDTIQCQSTLCLLSVRHDSVGAELTFMMSLANLSSFANGFSFTQRTEHEDGSVHNVIFISRSGHALFPAHFE